ncbi:DUF4755 domain-containing protein [Klebsiella variicola]|uniref:DUF4755 domain-containing protein n=1 Tax=Klebsiella variicola TaxID=244366 RepID=UPI000D655F99|nr:DUF4755 domain-containing protein [Klebsiella variicola]
MTEMTAVKQPQFLMMKRVWLAIALPASILLLGGLKPFAEFVWVWGFVSLFLLMFAYKKFRIKKWNASTKDYFNNNNDGIWSHEFGPTWMKIDEHKGLIHLKEENTQKSYPFSAVKEWRYNLTTNIQRTGTQRELDRTHNFHESGFFITVDDIQYPEWRVMFFPTSGDFNSQEGSRNTEIQLKRWMQVFDNVINKN